MKKSVRILFLGVWASVAAVPLAAAEEHLTTAPTLNVITQFGVVAALHADGSEPGFNLVPDSGPTLNLLINSASAVWKNGQKLGWDKLQNGDRAKVRFVRKDGKVLVKTVELI